MRGSGQSTSVAVESTRRSAVLVESSALGAAGGAGGTSDGARASHQGQVTCSTKAPPPPVPLATAKIIDRPPTHPARLKIIKGKRSRGHSAGEKAKRARRVLSLGAPSATKRRSHKSKTDASGVHAVPGAGVASVIVFPAGLRLRRSDVRRTAGAPQCATSSSTDSALLLSFILISQP